MRKGGKIICMRLQTHAHTHTHTGNPLGTLSQAALREAAVRRLQAQPFESQKHVELLEGAKKELDRLVRACVCVCLCAVTQPSCCCTCTERVWHNCNPFACR